MIEKVVKKNECVGCEACVQICPQKAITAVRDAEGFLYPQTDVEKCIECGLCEQVCQTKNKKQPREPLNIYAAYNKNYNTKITSSSGGLFASFAEAILSQNGSVAGAVFDREWNVCHCVTNKKSELEKIKRAKYVQSRIGNCYNEIDKLLKTDQKVLFSGTPCEIAGLLTFLGRDDANLVTIEIVCHGSPSPSIWSNYLDSICDRQEITSISFKDKSKGWENYSISIKGIEGRQILKESRFKNPYVQGFLKNLYLRPSCYDCQNKSFRSGADLTIGDYWGVDSAGIAHDGMGISLCYVNTTKGEKLLEQVAPNFEYRLLTETEINKSRVLQGAVKYSAKAPANVKEFWTEYKQSDTEKRTRVIWKYAKDPLITRIKRTIRAIIPSFIINNRKNRK